jgi:hypothetical protein
VLFVRFFVGEVATFVLAAFLVTPLFLSFRRLFFFLVAVGEPVVAEFFAFRIIALLASGLAKIWVGVAMLFIVSMLVSTPFALDFRPIAIMAPLSVMSAVVAIVPVPAISAISFPTVVTAVSPVMVMIAIWPVKEVAIVTAVTIFEDVAMSIVAAIFVVAIVPVDWHSDIAVAAGQEQESSANAQEKT